jgi:glyoxylase-like metal-dependent hydrolase (beta-lactamase superfamily II)
VYGLEPLKKAGADIWAHARGREYLESDVSRQRLEQRKQTLAPWVDARTKILPADRWLDGDATFALGGVNFDILYVGTSHAPEDVMLYVREERVLFAGDLFFSGRIPFVGNADSKGWLKALDRMLAIKPKIVVPGHGNASSDPQKDIELTRDYLAYLREKMGAAVKNLETFDEAYAAVDWSRYKHLPAFDAANRINAYGTYLLMEQEALKQ